MAVRAWLQKNQVFDRDLVKLFPEYGVSVPDRDLKSLSEDKWEELKTKLMTDRAAELKDPRGRDRMLKKLTKVEKLWKSARSPGKQSKNKHHSKSTSKLSVASSDSKEKEKEKENVDANTKKMKHKSVTSQLSSSSSSSSSSDTIEARNGNNDDGALRQKYTAKCEELKRTRQMFEEYKAQRSHEEKEANALHTKYDALQSEHQALNEKYEALQTNDDNNRSNALTALQAKYDALHVKHQALKKDVKTLRQSDDKYQSVQREFDLYKEKIEKQQPQLQETETPTQTNETPQTLKTKIAELQTDADTNTNMIASLQIKEKELNAQLSALQSTQQTETDAHIQRTHELEQELEATKQELDLMSKLKSEMEDSLKAQLAVKDKECAELRLSATTSDDALDDKLVKLEVQLENVQEKNVKLSKQLQQATQDTKSAKKSEHRRYEHLYQQFEEYKEGASAERTKFELNEIALQDERTELKLQQNKTRIENSRLQNKVNLLKESLSHREEECSEMKEQFDALQEEHQKSNSDNHGSSDHDKMEKLKELNKALEAKYKRKAAQYSKLLSDYNEFVQQNSEDSESMTASMEQLRRDYAALEDKYKAAHKELESMQQMYSNDNGNHKGNAASSVVGDAAETLPSRRRKQKPKKKRNKNKLKPRAMTVTTGEEYFDVDEVDVKPAKIEDVSGDDADSGTGDEQQSSVIEEGDEEQQDDEEEEDDGDDDDDDDNVSTKSKKGRKKKYKPRLKTPRHKLQQSSSSPTSDTCADSATEKEVADADDIQGDGDDNLDE